MLGVSEITGVIDRRILINYRVSLNVLQRLLPQGLTPLAYNGYGVVGICLIRLRQMRLKGMPSFLGWSSENAAHRIAIEIPNSLNGSGVFVPRRDTSSRVLSWVGGRLFPGVQHYSEFQVNETETNFQLEFSRKGVQQLKIHCQRSSEFETGSIFRSLEDVSQFFKDGSLGYSPSSQPDRFDAVTLVTKTWSVSPLKTLSADSQYFMDETKFPPGSIDFDNAILMENIEHDWVASSPS